MKKVYIYITILILITTLVSCNNRPDNIKVAAFNIYFLGSRTVSKDYDRLAEVLSEYSIIGIQEIIDKEGVDLLRDALNDKTGVKWEYHISNDPKGNPNRPQYFGFLWRSDHIDEYEDCGEYVGEERFYRTPYGMRFTSGKLDFIFVIAHLSHQQFDTSREVSVLVNVYDYYLNIFDDEDDVIIGGDFNLESTHESFETLFKHENKLKLAVDVDTPTTVKKYSLGRSIDNIIFSETLTKESTGISGATDFTNGNYSNAKWTISDHLPVWIELSTR